MLDNVKNHVIDNKKIYKNGAVVVGGYFLTRYLIKKFALTPVEYIPNNEDKDLQISTKLSNKDKKRIEDYFHKIELFLDSYFLKKYTSYFKEIDFKDKVTLKEHHENLELKDIIFPVSYYKIHENSDLVSFLNTMANNLGLESNEIDYEIIVKNIKEFYKINSHQKILNELKQYLSEVDYPNWQKLYDSKPVTILN